MQFATCVFKHKLLFFDGMTYIGTAPCSSATKQSKKTNSIMMGLVCFRLAKHTV